MDLLKSRLQAVEAAEDLEEPVKTQVAGLYKQAIAITETAENLARSSKEYEISLKDAPARVEKIRAQLEKPTDKPASLAFEDARGLNADQLEGRLGFQTLQLWEAQTRLADREKTLGDLRGRPEKLRQLTQDTTEQLAKSKAEPEAPETPNEPRALTEARAALTDAKEGLLQEQLRSCEQEQAGYEARLALAAAERDLAAREAFALEALVKALQSQVQAQRQEEAAETVRQAQEARRRMLGLPSAARQIAELNLGLSREIEELTRNETRFAAELESAKALQKEIEEDFDRAKKRVEIVGLTQPIGLLLRQQRMLLPDLASCRRDAEGSRREISRVAEKLLEIDDGRRSLPDLQAKLTDSLTSLSQTLDAASFKAVEKDVKGLFQDHRESLDVVQARCAKCLKTLGDLDFAKRSLASSARDYAQFIDQRLFWIRNMPPLGSPDDIRNVWRSARWALRAANWRGLGSDFWSSLSRSTDGWLTALLIALAIVQSRRWARRRAQRGSGAGAAGHRGPLGAVLKNLVFALGLGAGWPLLVCFLSWCVFRTAQAGDFSLAATQGLIWASLLFATSAFVRAICGDGGIGQTDFGWPEGARLGIRRRLLWLGPALLIGGALSGGLEVLDDEAKQALGRLAFMPAALALSLFCFRVFRPRGSVMTALVRDNPDSLLIRARHIWRPAAVGAPLALALLAAVGYYYTALHLAGRVVATAWLVIALVLTRSLLLGWLRRTQLGISLEQRRRSAQADGEGRGPAAEVEGETPETMAKEDRNRIANLDRQTRESLAALFLGVTLLGLWLVWAPALPALDFIGRLEVWHYTTGAAGREQIAPVTVATLVTAVVAAVITFACARRLPSLVELLLLKRVAMQQGTRYAIATLLRYAITAIGLLVVLRMLGLKWSNVQWLVAALGIGLGFGLQEVIANFVSGIILLFERPIRLGDVVTVGDVTGKVTRMQIRATTIRDWDGKELVVPNKSFITGELINWSLSDPITRLTIPVGIAYGSDTALARKLLLDAARKSDLVLDDPEPTAYFLQFGESSLNFSLRVYVSSIEDRFAATHDLNCAIDKAFREAGIEIAFPQRDVHLNASSPIDVRVVPANQRQPDSSPSEKGT
jgi:potassium efflux system protein